MEIRKPAAIVRQGPLILYATSFTIRDFLHEGFYSIDRLDPDEYQPGYQRVLDKRRTKRISGYFTKAWHEGDAFLPTSVLLATQKNIAFDESKNELFFNLKKTGPFNVVDGQHRIEGLISAAKQTPAMKDFQIAVNIATNVDEVSQMCHFLIVNTTQKSVDKSIEQGILSRLTGMINFQNIPSLPKWIQRQVERGEDQQALNIIKYLNQNPNSPWYKKIEMANQTEELSRTTIRQKTFAHSLKRFILSSNNPLMHSDDMETRNKILCNYWSAIKSLLISSGDENSVLFKSSGANLFHMISSTIFSQLFNLKDFREETIRDMLSRAFDALDHETGMVGNPGFWGKGGGASMLNMTTLRKFSSSLNRAIISIDKESSFRV
ncbi:MAG: DGQHR domain-containing protein [Oligoflexales bacterium]